MATAPIRPLKKKQKTKLLRHDDDRSYCLLRFTRYTLLLLHVLYFLSTNLRGGKNIVLQKRKLRFRLNLGNLPETIYNLLVNEFLGFNFLFTMLSMNYHWQNV